MLWYETLDFNFKLDMSLCKLKLINPYVEMDLEYIYTKYELMTPTVMIIILNVKFMHCVDPNTCTSDFVTYLPALLSFPSFTLFGNQDEL